MALDPNEIDDLFKDRFTGLKDHSVNPASQWNSFESMLSDSPTGKAASVATGGSYLGLKAFSVAASLALIISVVAFSTNQEEDAISNSEIPIETSEIFPSGSTTKAAFSSSESIFELSNSSDQSNVASFTPKNVVSIINSSKFIAAKPVQDKRSVDITKVELPSEVEYLATTSHPSQNQDIGLMTVLSLDKNQLIGIVSTDRDMPEYEYYSEGKPAKALFGRAGVRFGTGESNSSESPNLWTANAMASVGFKQYLSTKAGLMIELGYLRRSGNALERNQDIAASRSYSAFNNSLNAASSNEEITHSFTIDKSIIAERLDFIQIPISLFYDYNEKLEFSVGAFTDLLVYAKNQTYIVYNEEAYVRREPNAEELNSLAGINRFRFGVSLGVDYQIKDNLSLDIRALTPLNSPFDKDNNLVESKSNFNQALDLMIGLRYTI